MNINMTIDTNEAEPPSFEGDFGNYFVRVGTTTENGRSAEVLCICIIETGLSRTISAMSSLSLSSHVLGLWEATGI